MEELKARASQYVIDMLLRESIAVELRSTQIAAMRSTFGLSQPDAVQVAIESASIMVKLARMLDKGELNENL